MPTTPRIQSIIAGLLLCIATLLSYRAVLHNGFVSFDDIEYLFDNQRVSAGLSLDSLTWALTATYEANWFPLTWVSHMADMSLFGANPFGHHLMSLVLHTLNVILLQLIFTRMTGSVWRSAAVAAIFALHPLQVESVAWIAERKNVLSTLFFMLTIIAYLRYIRKRTIFSYAGVLVVYACGLASKPMLVTLPFILLILDVWPLGRTGTGNVDHGLENGKGITALIKEKIPLLALAVSLCIITVIVQLGGGAIKGFGAGSLAENAAHALVNYVRYMFTVLWPADLAVMYPYVKQLPLWQPLGAAALLALITVLTIRSLPNRPYWAFGWLWFIITLAPVVGFIRIGAHSIADRYTYIPLIGISVAVVWTVADLLANVRYGKTVEVMGAVLLYGALSVATTNQVGYWKDSISLFEHAIAVTKDNWLAHNNISVELVKRGQIAQAYQHVRESIRINPENADAYYNLGKIYSNLGDDAQAIHAYKAALAFKPDYGNAYLKLAMIYLEAGDATSALAMYRTLERIDHGKADLIKSYLTPANNQVQ